MTSKFPEPPLGLWVAMTTLGLDPEKLGGIARIDPAVLNRIRTGRLVPSTGQRAKISKAFGLSPRLLFGRTLAERRDMDRRRASSRRRKAAALKYWCQGKIDLHAFLLTHWTRAAVPHVSYEQIKHVRPGPGRPLGSAKNKALYERAYELKLSGKSWTKVAMAVLRQPDASVLLSPDAPDKFDASKVDLKKFSDNLRVGVWYHYKRKS